MDSFILIKPHDLEALLERTLEKVINNKPHEKENSQDTIWLKVYQAAAYLQIPESSIYQLTHKKKIKFQKVGRGLRFRKEDLDDYVLANVQSKGRKSFLN
ncbi:DNA binding domain-containing protein, excisionase family [Spirosomataceae bacterium TFI 002]|nr:DNA binding domain-containing protein, excisionase family [Spirosomataceae bacterium TFI 002]